MLNWNALGLRPEAEPADSGSMLDGMLITGQAGFVNDTKVASNMGWRKVQTLGIGDKVLTFDHGMQRIIDIQRETFAIPEPGLPASRLPVLVPRGALNNRSDMWLMPDQGLLVESDATRDALGDPFAVVPARALAGYRGIASAPPPGAVEVTTLSFARDEVIYVEGGMLAHCPRPRQILIEPCDGEAMLYDVLDIAAAMSLVRGLIEGRQDAEFVCAPEELAALPELARAS